MYGGIYNTEYFIDPKGDFPVFKPLKKEELPIIFEMLHEEFYNKHYRYFDLDDSERIAFFLVPLGIEVFLYDKIKKTKNSLFNKTTIGTANIDILEKAIKNMFNLSNMIDMGIVLDNVLKRRLYER